MTNRPEQGRTEPSDQLQTHHRPPLTTPAPSELAVDREVFEEHLDGADENTIAAWAGHAPEKWQRDAAFDRLLPTIERIGQFFHRRYPNGPIESPADAAAVIWQRLAKYNPTKGSFSKWSCVVVHNWIKTRFCQETSRRSFFEIEKQYKKTADDETDSSDSETPRRRQEGSEPRPPEYRTTDDRADERAENILVWADNLRDALDRMREVAKSRVNYYAVFLMHLRLIVAKMLSNTIEHEERSNTIERVIRWRSDEQCLTFRQGWPELGTIWNGCRPLLNQPPNFITVDDFCKMVNNTSPQIELTAALWNQWTKRARDHFREVLRDDRRWKTLFENLLTNRTST